MTDTSLRARVVLGELEAMGLTLDDLLAEAGRDAPASDGGITVAEYLPTVAAAYLPRTRRTYNSYWTLTVELLGDLALDRVTIEDLMGVAEEAARRARVRRPGSDGRASRESCVAAMRAIFARALKAGLVSSNPALLVDKPRRLPNRRRALSPVELDELWEAVTATTRDPELDLLLLRFHLESGARRMGRSTCGSGISTRPVRRSGSGRSSVRSASSRSAGHCSRRSAGSRCRGVRAGWMTRRFGSCTLGGAGARR